MMYAGEITAGEIAAREMATGHIGASEITTSEITADEIAVGLHVGPLATTAGKIIPGERVIACEMIIGGMVARQIIARAT